MRANSHAEEASVDVRSLQSLSQMSEDDHREKPTAKAATKGKNMVAAKQAVSKHDVHFFGAGHHGNIARARQELYKQLLQEHYQEYEQTNRFFKREFVFEKIIQPIVEAGGHFYDQDGKLLDTKDDENRRQIFEKVSQSLRDKCRRPPHKRIKRKAKQETKREAKRVAKGEAPVPLKQEMETLKEDIESKKEELEGFMDAVTFVKDEAVRTAKENQELRAEVARLQQENTAMQDELWGNSSTRRASAPT